MVVSNILTIRIEGIPMIRESFIEAVKNIERARNYHPRMVTELISICNKVSFNHSQKYLLDMFRKCVVIVHSIPDTEYKLHIDIIETFTTALVELGKKHSKVTRYFDGFSFDPQKMNFRKYVQFSDPHLFAMALSLNLAVRLEDLGLPGEAFNFLIKSFDPWLQKYDRASAVGDVTTQNSQLFDYFLVGTFLMGIEDNRKVLIGRSAMHFRLLKVLGDIENDSLTTYIMTEQFVKKGKDATYEDILFLTNYLELIALKKEKHKDFDKVAELLIEQYNYEKERSNQDYSFIIATSLAKVTNTLEWVKEALNCTPSEPFWSEMFKIQAMNIFLNVNDENQTTQLIGIVETFLSKAATIYNDRMLFELFKHKFSDFINNIIVGCINIGQDKLSVELAFLWCTSKPDQSIVYEGINKNVILAIPNYHTIGGHFIIYDSGKVVFTGIFSHRNLSDIFTLKEKVEAAWFSILDDEETLKRNLENRHQVEVSKQYIEDLSEYIGVEHLEGLLAVFPNNTHFHYLELSWTNTPVVSILSNRTKHSYSVLIDNSVDNFKEIKKALIWVNPDGSLPMSLREAEAIEYLLNQNNIPYEIYIEEACTRSLFMEKYEDPSYDLIWVSAHGKFNSDNPPFSELYVASNNDTVTAWELQKKIPHRSGKRKLILNACESGTAGVRFNSMGFVGIAASITNNHQTVLGHLWVADSLGSSVYGIFLMNQILKGKSLPYAAKASSNALLAGNSDVVNKLTEMNPDFDIIDRVRNSTSKDLSLPFYSMSAVVFE